MPNCSECHMYQVIQGETIPCRILPEDVRKLIQPVCYASSSKEYDEIVREQRMLFQDMLE